MSAVIPVGILPRLAVLVAYRASSASSATSSVANAIDTKATEAARFDEDSVSLFGAKALALDELRHLSQSTELETPLTGAALQTAQLLIRSLPSGVPMPELSAESDGAVMFEWLPAKYRMLSVSINGSDRLPYAWLVGADRGYGVEPAGREGISSSLVSRVRQVMNINASIWAS